MATVLLSVTGWTPPDGYKGEGMRARAAWLRCLEAPSKQRLDPLHNPTQALLPTLWESEEHPHFTVEEAKARGGEG